MPKFHNFQLFLCSYPTLVYLMGGGGGSGAETCITDTKKSNVMNALVNNKNILKMHFYMFLHLLVPFREFPAKNFRNPLEDM